MSTLVTGATGFVGKAVARELAGTGHALRLLVRGPGADARASALGLPGAVVPGDLEEAGSVSHAVEGASAVVHLAAIVAPEHQRDASAVLRINCDAAVRLAQSARAAGARRFVFMSSIAAMGFWSGLATAESPCRPVTDYGRAKLAAERALLAMASPDFEVVVLRPPTVYGPGEPYNFLSWVRAIDRGVFRIIGSGDNRFPLATTENVARASRAAVEGRLGTGIYLVADREPYSISRIHAAVLSALGRKPPRFRVPKPVALGAALANEALHRVTRAPLVLSRARVTTLTVDQRFDIEPLLRAGTDLDAPLEEWVARTVRDYEGRGVL